MFLNLARATLLDACRYIQEHPYKVLFLDILSFIGFSVVGSPFNKLRGLLIFLWVNVNLVGFLTALIVAEEREEIKKEEQRKEKEKEKKIEEAKVVEERLMELECERNVARKRLSLERLERRMAIREQRVAMSGWCAERQKWILEKVERSLERTERELERVQFRECMQTMERMIEQLKEENAALKEVQQQLDGQQEPGRGWMGDLRPRVPEMESTRWWGRQEGPTGREGV